MAGRYRERQRRQRRTRRVILALLIVGLVSIPTSFILYRYPDAQPIDTSGITTIAYPARYGFPAVRFHYRITFNAQGGFGADNPITIHITITNANFTFIHTYCCVIFTDAYNVTNPNYNEQPKLSFTYWTKNDSYTASGQAGWSAAGPVWMFLQFSRETGVTYSVIDRAIMQTGPQVITIDHISDTRAWQSDELHTRVELIGLGFIPLLSYGAFIALFSLRVEQPKNSAEDGETKTSQEPEPSKNGLPIKDKGRVGGVPPPRNEPREVVVDKEHQNREGEGEPHD